MNGGFYSRKQLESFGFSELGENVLISEKASIYGAKYMKIGNNVRIDDFCILVGNIILKNYIHIAAYSGLHASKGSITFDDYSTLSSHGIVYAVSDDYSGKYMTNSTVPSEYKNEILGDIYLGRHAVVGCASVLLPHAYLPEGVAIHAMSLVNSKLEPWNIYGGVPCRLLKPRSQNALQLERSWNEKGSQIP